MISFGTTDIRCLIFKLAWDTLKHFWSGELHILQAQGNRPKLTKQN